MTKGDKIKLRAELAGKAMAALASIPWDGTGSYIDLPKLDAQRAVEYSDALMAELGISMEDEK